MLLGFYTVCKIKTFQMVHKMLFIVLTYFVADFKNNTHKTEQKLH